MSFGSDCCNKPCREHHVSFNSFCGCRTSHSPPRPLLDDIHECHPGFFVSLDHTQRATSGLAQCRMKVMETIPHLSVQAGMLHGAAEPVADLHGSICGGGRGGSGGGGGGGGNVVMYCCGKKNIDDFWTTSSYLYRLRKQAKQPARHLLYQRS